MKVQILNFNKVLTLTLTELSISRVVHSKNLKSLIRVPYVVQLKVQVLSFNIILISSPWIVTSPSYPFMGKFGR